MMRSATCAMLWNTILHSIGGILVVSPGDIHRARRSRATPSGRRQRMALSHPYRIYYAGVVQEYEDDYARRDLWYGRQPSVCWLC